MSITILSENLVLQDAKLLAWEGGIKTDSNWFLIELIFKYAKHKSLGSLDFAFFKKAKIFNISMTFTFTFQSIFG